MTSHLLRRAVFVIVLVVGCGGAAAVAEAQPARDNRVLCD